MNMSPLYMPSVPEKENIDSFFLTVQKLITHERERGNDHFSERNIKSHNIAEFDFNELDAHDRALVQLYAQLLESAKNMASQGTITEDFYSSLCKEFRNTTRQSANETQSIFRAYMNNRFGTLILTVQMYLSYKNCNDEVNKNEMAKRLQEEANTYLPLLQ